MWLYRIYQRVFGRHLTFQMWALLCLVLLIWVKLIKSVPCPVRDVLSSFSAIFLFYSSLDDPFMAQILGWDVFQVMNALNGHLSVLVGGYGQKSDLSRP